MDNPRITHVLMAGGADGYWHCRTGACSWKVHEEDLENAGYLLYAGGTLFIEESDFHDRIHGEEDAPDDNTPEDGLQ